ncbi:MAG TPA: hypothetical protein DDW52_10880 [Planctomycetaceae bacterium]|nr:hypothetical protein [Planctomycetaceae bacterium]
MKIARILVLAIIVFAVSWTAGWFVKRQRVVKTQQACIEIFDQTEAYYYYDFQLEPGERLSDFRATDDAEADTRVGFLSKWLGDINWSHDIFYVTFAKFDTVADEGAIAAKRAEVGDAEMEPLAELKSLRWLALNGTAVSDQGLSKVAGQGRLERLWIGQTEISDAAIPALLACQKLEHLSIEGTQISDRGLRQLAQLPNLQVVAAGGNQQTALGISELVKAASIEEVYLDVPSVDDRVAASVAQQVNLRVLSLRRSRLSREGCKHFGQLGNLEVLRLDGSTVDDAALSAIGDGLPKLRELTLGGCNISDQGLKAFKSCVGLETLVVDGTRCTLPGVIKFLQDLGHSEEAALSIAFDVETGPDGNPVSINFGGLTIEDSDLARIEQFRNLQWLEMPASRLTREGIEQLSSFDLSSLSLLRIRGDRLTAESVRKLAALPALRDLHIYGAQLAEQNVAALRKEFPRLRIYTRPLAR